MTERPSWLPTGCQFQLLHGYSGAGIAQVELNDGSQFVRKIAAEPSRNAQLRTQIERQRAFRSAQDVLSVPAVLAEGELSGRYFVDMEVIRGLDGPSYLRSAPLSAVRAIADQLARYLAEAALTSALGPSRSRSLRAGLESKLGEIRARLGSSDPVSTVALDCLETVVSRVPDIEAATACHGDLTLENLVVDREGVVWALDLTPPPFEHVWFDVAKLRQDLHGGWYLRSGAPIPTGVRDCVLGSIDVAVEWPEPGVSVALEAMSFARILPYAPLDDRPFVVERVRALAVQALS